MHALCWLTLVSAGFFTWQTPPQPKTPNYEYRKDHDPDGIGKFYLGREIAQVMGHQAAAWLERPEREKEERPSKLWPMLKLKEGDIVADVGAGSGYLQLNANGRLNLHGATPGAPMGTLHIGPEGGPVNALRGSIAFDAAQSGPDAIQPNTCRIYYRSNQFVIQFNYNGVQYYAYLQLVGQLNPNVTWGITTTPL